MFSENCTPLRINGNFRWMLTALHSDMKFCDSKYCKTLITSNTASSRIDLSLALTGAYIMGCSEAQALGFKALQGSCVSEPTGPGRGSRLWRPFLCQTPPCGPCRRKLGMAPTLQARPHSGLGHRRGRAAHSLAVCNAPMAAVLLLASANVFPGVSRASWGILTKILLILPHQFC